MAVGGGDHADLGTTAGPHLDGDSDQPLLTFASDGGYNLFGVSSSRSRVRAGAANATPKLTSVIAGMAAGADSVDDLDVVRAGGMKRLFGGVYAASTLGILLREFTHGHTRQLSAGLRRHLVALAARTPILAGIQARWLVDIDSLLRPVYGHAKQGASFGHTKVSGKSVLRRGLSPLAVTIATPVAAPVLAAVRLRAGRAGSGRGAASMITEAVNTAIAAGAQPGKIVVRADSAYCGAKTVAAVVKAGATFSFTITRNPAVEAAIASIGDEAFTPVRYPGAVLCETVRSDLIEGPWAHQPSGSFAANAAWNILAAICHNLLRAAATLTSTARYTAARGATLRTQLLDIPARLARPQRRPILHLPARWPPARAWLHLWQAVFVT